MPENLCVAREQRCVADMQSGPPTCMPFATIFMPFVGFLFCVYELKSPVSRLRVGQFIVFVSFPKNQLSWSLIAASTSSVPDTPF